MNYFTQNLARAFRKSPFFSTINIIGLSLGLAISLALLSFIKRENDFDKHHQNFSNIFRVLTSLSLEGQKETWCITPNALAPGVLNSLPEIKSVTRVLKHGFGEPAYISVGIDNFKEENLYYCDNSFLEIFNLVFLEGSRLSSLETHNSAIISETTSKKFYNGNAIGKTFIVDFKDTLVVTGVYRDLPLNSSLDCNIIASYQSTVFYNNLSWNNFSVETFCLLNDHHKVPFVENSITNIFLNHSEKRPGLSIEKVILQPLGKIHLYSGTYKLSFITRNGNIKELFIISLLALVVLLIGCINYMNLATAQFHKKIKDTGLKKILGASRKQLIIEVYFETGTLVLASILIGVLLFLALSPTFRSLLQQPPSFFEIIFTPFFGASLLLIWLFTTLLAGSYPAFSLSRFTPIQIMQHSFHKNLFSIIVRRWLLILQFSISIILITYSIVVNKQMEFVSKKDLGFTPENVIALTLPNSVEQEKIELAVTEFKRKPGVVNAAMSQGLPGTPVSVRKLFKSIDDKEGVSIQTNNSGAEIVDVLKLKIIAGQSLPTSKQKNDNTIQVVINETAAKYLGYSPEEAVGKKVNMQLGDSAYIVGVVNDFNYASLESLIQCYAFHNDVGDSHPYLVIRINTSSTNEILKKLGDQFKSLFPMVPFEFLFLDQYTNSLYKNHKRNEKVILSFSYFAIFITCLGLFGLSTFNINQQEKEIAVRKVLGSSSKTLAFHLIKSFMYMFITSIVIAFPLAWYFCSEWLNNFAYRTGLTFTVFLSSTSLILLIGISTISIQTIKAVVKSPGKSLRNQ